MRAKQTKKKDHKKKTLIAIVIALVILLALLIILAFALDAPILKGITAEPTSPTSNTLPLQPTDPTVAVHVEQLQQLDIALDYGLTIVEAGKYIGVYMEDGTDEVVSDVLMLHVRNDGESDIQYAELTVATAGGDASFSLSTLPAGESAILLEKNRMQWSATEDYSSATVQNVALFAQPLSLCEDMVKLQALDGVINVTNISGQDITGDITVYYKNAASDMLYGGITYRIRLEGGLKNDEIRQVVADHFSQDGSRVMFVTVG